MFEDLYSTLFDNCDHFKLNNFEINLIDVKLNFKKPFGKITNKSSEYIKECFEIAINIMKKKLGFALINGPVSKTHFLHGKYNGITEYLSHKTSKKNKKTKIDMKIKNAIILAAGFGKRLNPLTLKMPKPLLKIGDITLLENIDFVMKEGQIIK